MEKVIFTINIPKQSHIRNPYALEASSRKAGKMKLKWNKRKNNPKRQDWMDG